MHISNINDAKINLSHLIKRALAGDEIIIARANEPLVKLTPLEQDESPRIGGEEKLTLVTRDRQVQKYEIATLAA